MRLRAPALCVASVAAYLGATMAMKLPPKGPPEFITALDLAGVTRIDIASRNGMTINIADGVKPRVQADNDGGTKVVVNRSGDRLSISTKIETFDEVDVFLPPTFRQLVVKGSTTVKNRGRLDAFSVESFGDLDWNGDAGELELRAHPRGSGCDRSADIAVAGRIGRLLAVASDGDVTVSSPQTMDSVEVRLGPASTLDLDKLRVLPASVRITDLDGAPIAPPAVVGERPGNPAGRRCSADQEAAAATAE